MIRGLLGLLAIGLVVAVTIFLAEHPGTVTVTWQGWHIDTSLATGLLILLLFAAALIGFVSLIRWLITAPARHAHRRRSRMLLGGYHAIMGSLVALASGDLKETERLRTKSLRQFAKSGAGQPAITRLIAAQTAILRGDEQAARQEYSSMLDQSELAFLGLRGLIVDALKRDDTRKALDLTERAKRLRPNSPWVLQAELTLRSRTGNWRDATSSLRDAVKQGVLPKQSGRSYQSALMVARSEEALNDQRLRDALTFAKQAYDLDTSFVPAIIVYARMLQKNGRQAKARHLLEKAWVRNTHPHLARAYLALFEHQSPTEQFREMRRLVEINGAPSSYLALGETALTAHLWSEAREALMHAGAARAAHSASDAANAHPWPARLCRAMLTLEENDGEDPQTIEVWQQRLDHAPPEEAWICTNCGASAVEWAPVCGACGSLATMVWGTGIEPNDTSAMQRGNTQLLMAAGDVSGAESMGVTPPDLSVFGRWRRMRIGAS